MRKKIYAMLLVCVLAILPCSTASAHWTDQAEKDQIKRDCNEWNRKQIQQEINNSKAESFKTAPKPEGGGPGNASSASSYFTVKWGAGGYVWVSGNYITVAPDTGKSIDTVTVKSGSGKVTKVSSYGYNGAKYLVTGTSKTSPAVIQVTFK